MFLFLLLLWVKIRGGEESYHRKLDLRVQQSDIREVWSGMRDITGYKTSKQVTEGGVDRAND